MTNEATKSDVGHVKTKTNGRAIRVRATNYDGTPHWEHPALLLQDNDGLLITETSSGLEVVTERGIWNSPYNTRGHYWPDRWYNVIRLEEPGRGLNGFYCNVATPVQFDGESLRYIDLQLDVRVFVSEAEWTYTVLDADEFEEARKRYAYPDDLIVRCRQAVDEIIALVEARSFPFEERRS
jgi:protein associated with RNAse G/E